MESFGEYNDKGNVYRYKTFDKITSKEEAYFIGFMMMDGSFLNFKKGNKRYPRMGITTTFHYFVEYYQQMYCPDTTITTREARSSKKVNAINPTKEIEFPRKMNRIFERFGLLDYKPNRKVVGIPKRFVHCFVLGVMDADGCFVVRHRKDCRTPRLSVHVVSSCINCLEWIQRYAEEELGFASSVYQRKNSACYELRINNTKSAIKFGQFIYSDLPEVYYHKRKRIYDKYIMSCANSGELLEALRGNQQPSLPFELN